MLTNEMVEALKIYYLDCRDIRDAAIDHLRFDDSSPEWWDK